MLSISIFAKLRKSMKSLVLQTGPKNQSGFRDLGGELAASSVS